MINEKESAIFHQFLLRHYLINQKHLKILKYYFSWINYSKKIVFYFSGNEL